MKNQKIRNASILIVLLLVVASKLYAQNNMQHKIDSMIRVVRTTKVDSVKAITLLIISEKYRSINPPEALPFAHQSLEIAKKMNWKSKMADAYGVLGMNHSILSNDDSAVFYLKQSLELAEELNNNKQIGLACGTLGNVFYFQSKYPQAIEYFIKANKALEKSNDSIGLAASLTNIGSIYLDLNEFDQALPYFEKALKLNEATNFKMYQAVNLSNMGIVYGMKGDKKKELVYLMRALSVGKEINDLLQIASSLNEIAATYNDLGNTDSAYYNAIQGLQLSKQLQSIPDVGFAYLTLAQILYDAAEKNAADFLNKNFSAKKHDCYLQAKTYADSGVRILNSIHNIEQLAKAFLILSNTQKALGDYQNALESYSKFSAFHDTVFNMDVNKKLTQKAMQYDFDKKETAAKEEQEKKDIRHKNIRNSISLGFAGALIFLVVVYRQRNRINKEKKRSEELLLNILPEEVAEELKEKGSADAKHFDEVTVMFTDFKGFTQISEKLTPAELVAEIDTCFKAFDNIISKHNIEKIKTIGDAYMCAGGLPLSNKTHAEDVVKAALEIQIFIFDHLQQRKKENKEVFEIRIGIHTGPVVAGIVGVKKFAYDIWGDTVNIASRMESSGEAGKVNISGRTYELVKDKFKCLHRGKIQAKNKGEIDMYFVEKI